MLNCLGQIKQARRHLRLHAFKLGTTYHPQVLSVSTTIQFWCLDPKTMKAKIIHVAVNLLTSKSSWCLSSKFKFVPKIDGSKNKTNIHFAPALVSFVRQWGAQNRFISDHGQSLLTQMMTIDLINHEIILHESLSVKKPLFYPRVSNNILSTPH